jgi:hypothetical protein
MQSTKSVGAESTPLLSVAMMLTVYCPAALGIPVIWPLSERKIVPLGIVLLVLNVYGGVPPLPINWAV